MNRSEINRSVQLRRSLLWLCAIAMGLLFSGCAGIQSSLDPAGPQSLRISRLWWFLFGTCAVVFVLVIGFLIYAVIRARRQGAEKVALPETERRMTRVVSICVAVTVLILFAFLVISVSTSRALSSLQRPNPMTIQVI